MNQRLLHDRFKRLESNAKCATEIYFVIFVKQMQNALPCNSSLTVHICMSMTVGSPPLVFCILATSGLSASCISAMMLICF